MPTDIEKKEIELVLARLQAMPSGVGVSVGSEGNFTRDQLIEHVKSGDDIGRIVKEMQLEYLRLLKTNVFYV